MTNAANLERLLQQARNGDQSAEQRIFQYIVERFRLFARLRIGDSEAANDVVQDACATIFKKYKTETFSSGFEAWAYGIVRMKIRNYLYKLTVNRDKNIAEWGASCISSGTAPSIDPDLEIQLSGCLKKIMAIRPQYARVLNLIYQGYTTDEVCARLGISRNHLYVLLNRARAMLRACLEKGEV